MGSDRFSAAASIESSALKGDSLSYSTELQINPNAKELNQINQDGEGLLLA